MLITRKSILSSIERTLDIPIKEADYAKWLKVKQGLAHWEPVQNIAPYLSADDREFIISGITKEEWDEMSVNDEESQD